MIQGCMHKSSWFCLNLRLLSFAIEKKSTDREIHRQTHRQTLCEKWLILCFECSTIRICNNLEHDFFCHHHTSISLRNMEVKKDSIFCRTNSFNKFVIKYFIIQCYLLIPSSSWNYFFSAGIASVEKWEADDSCFYVDCYASDRWSYKENIGIENHTWLPCSKIYI